MVHIKLLALCLAQRCCNSSMSQRKNLYPLISLAALSFHMLCPGAWHLEDMLRNLWRVRYSELLNRHYWDWLGFSVGSTTFLSDLERE